MKKYLYLALVAMLLGFTACGDDKVVEPEPTPTPVPTPTPNPEPNPDDNAITAEKLKPYVTATASLNETTQMWTANIQSSLANQSFVQGKNIKYGVTHNMTTSYTSSKHNKKNMVEWMYRYTGEDWNTNPNVTYLSAYRTLHGAVVFDNSIYATGSGNNYQASIENPYYNATYGVDENGEWQYLVENWWTQWMEDEQTLQNFLVLMEIHDDIIKGTATAKEKLLYEDYGGDAAFSSQTAYATYAKCYLQVFVEIDGKRYVVKEQQGKLRVPSANDHPLDGNYPYNNKNNNNNNGDLTAEL